MAITDKGQLFRFKCEDSSGNMTLIGLTTEKSLSRTKELKDLTNDDNPDFGKYVGAKKDAELEFTAIYDYEKNGYSILEDAFGKDNATPMEYGGTNAGEPLFTFDGHVSDLELTNETNERNEYSATIQVDSGITTTTVS